MDSSAKNSAKGAAEAVPLKQEIVLPEIRLLTQAERDSLREMADTVCTKVLGPTWDKKNAKAEERE
jgi:hypothetical protein